MTGRKPSLVWFLLIYIGSAWAFAKLLDLGAWPLGLAVAFLIRGASSIPLFRERDETGLVSTETIEQRTGSGYPKMIRSLGRESNQLLGYVVVAAFVVAIISQLPGACSGPSGVETEYRAR